MLPSLQYKADEVTARFTGNGIQVIVGVECLVDPVTLHADCPASFMAGDADCRRGNTTAGELRFVCVGGASLPTGAVLPAGTTNVRITNAYIETDSHPVGWDPVLATTCADMESDFAETGLLMCLMDEDGASVRQNTQLFGLAAAFGGRGGRGRRLQFGGGAAAATCTQTCKNAIQPLIDTCSGYSHIADDFAEPCSDANVVPGGFDASCLNGVDHLIMTCGIQSIDDMAAGSCSDTCGAWAGPWWASCREHLAPIIDAEMPGTSLMLDGFIAYCPTPCADVAITEVQETIITAAVTEDGFRTVVAAASGLADMAQVAIREVKHLAIFSVSVPGQASDFDADSTSGATAALIQGVAGATGVNLVDIAVLSAQRTAYDVIVDPTCTGRRCRPTEVDTQVAVEISIQGSAAANLVSGAATAMETDAAMVAIATQLGVAADSVAMVRSPVVETEATYTLPAGAALPADLDLMIHLIADLGTLVVVQTVVVHVPSVVLRNDGTICGTDGKSTSNQSGAACDL